MNIKTVIRQYLKYLQTIGRSYYTVKGTRSGLRRFEGFLKEERTDHIEDITADLLKDYQQDLVFSLTVKGRPLGLQSQSQLLSALRGFTKYLFENDYLIHDPGIKLTMPKVPRRLPKVILTVQEIKKLFKAADTQTNTGYRNRIILEILYDTAIRRAEMSSIKISGIDLGAGYIHVTGKGDRDRVVPLSQRVCELVNNYILHVRSSFLSNTDHEKDTGYLVLNRWGQQMESNAIWAVVKRCAKLSGIKKNISTHTLRHTCATQMLKNGAPIRHIQEMLGHASLNTTQIYTRVTINDLQKVHKKYHPSGSTDI